MPLSQTEYLWSGATPLLLISPARFFVYKGTKIDYFLRPPLDYRLLFALVSAAAAARGSPVEAPVVPVAPSCARYARNVSRAGAVGGAAARRRGGESVWALAAVASRSAWGRRRIRRVGGLRRAAWPFREREIRFFSSEV